MDIKNTWLYNIIRRAWYRIKSEYTLNNFINKRKYRNALQDLKGLHQGERCFIIGNGPSLTADDLTSLKSEYTFAANRIFYIFDKTEWRPTFYCAQDLMVVKDIADKIGGMWTLFDKVFLNSNCYKFFRREESNCKNVLFFNPKYKNGHKKILFSEDISDFIFDGGSVTYAAIQIAVYMGFSKIYLIGVDHNYAATSFKNNEISSSDVANSYFEGMPTNLKMTKPNTEGSTLSFIKAKEFCDSHNVIIMNATRGGKLEVFPRISLEDILKSPRL